MDSPNFTVDFEDELVTTATHLYSGTQIKTDAPLDNNGKASSFSPTDLVSAALASCMISIIAIHLDKQGRKLFPVKSQVKKVMAANPRRIAEVHIEFDFGSNHFTSDEIDTLERIAHACPVAKSLNSDLKIITNFK